jgi:hypothetical protein
MAFVYTCPKVEGAWTNPLGKLTYIYHLHCLSEGKNNLTNGKHIALKNIYEEITTTCISKAIFVTNYVLTSQCRPIGGAWLGHWVVVEHIFYNMIPSLPTHFPCHSNPQLATYYLIMSNDLGEPAVSYKWTCWVWEIAVWSSRLQEIYRSFERSS